MPRCTNYGCLQEYIENENLDSSCVHHDGKPIFHELRKGWTCCNQIVYDWDEFQKIKGCRVGKHTDIKKDVDFFKSQNQDSKNDTTSTTSSQPKVVVKDIAEYEKEQKRIQEEKEKNKPKDNEPMKNGEGKLFCGNLGCSVKVYVEEQNGDKACKYHIGKPVFHDLKKYWSCCPNKETWDWDEFMKIPTCVEGRHIPKYKATLG